MDQNSNVDDILATLSDTMYYPESVSPTSSASSSPTFTNMSHPNIPNLEGVRIKIVEHPAMKGLRFRYICEGRSAGSIPGVHSTPENKTFPTIEIEGYEGKVKVVVSCVTKDEPYRPHPHNLVGKEGCEHGICLATINGPPMRAVFSNLGIQCVKKKDIKSALEERERKRIDPFKTKFAHKDQPSSIDLNVVRLCFQAFIPLPGIKKPFPIPPVVSDPIFDKKSINDLVICCLCSCAAKVTGGDKIILLCEKVPKDDIKVRFFELRNNELYWEDFGEFQQTDVHKQTAITFKTPRYINPDVNHKVQVYIQLYRPSDGETSEALQFDFYPDPGMRTFPHVQRKLKRIQDMEIFKKILSMDRETIASKYSASPSDNANDIDDTVTSDSSPSKPTSSDAANELDGLRKRQNENFNNDNNDDLDEDYGNDETDICNCTQRKDGDIEFAVPHINFPTNDDATQTSTPIEEFFENREIDSPELATIDKITEWMHSNEFERTDSLMVENGDILTDPDWYKVTNDCIISITSDNQLNHELIEEESEIMDKCSLELLAKHSRVDQQHNDCICNLTSDAERHNFTTNAQVLTDIDKQFDEAATYDGLQIALNDPFQIPTVSKYEDNIKRKRIKTGGNPMNLLREIQQLEQMQTQCNISNLTNTNSPIWNIQPSIQPPPSNASIIPEVKTEPFLSPNCYGGSYRNTYINSPSPQPTSPMMNRNINTPSPGLMRNSSAENQSQMSNIYNQNQTNQHNYHNLTNNFNSPSVIPCVQSQGAVDNIEYNNVINTFDNYNNNNYSMINSSQQQEAQIAVSDIFVNRTSGGSFTPIYSNDSANRNNINTNNNTTFTPLQTMNVPNNIQQVHSILETATNNVIFNQFQDPNIMADSTLFNLSQLDDLLPLQNSDELRISNLSIST